MTSGAPAGPSILFVNYSGLPDGSAVMAARLASALHLRGWRLGMASPPNPWLRGALPAEMPWYDLPAARPAPSWRPDRQIGYLLALWRSVGQLAEIVQRDQWSLVHVHTLVNLSGALAALRAGRPLFWHVHELRLQSRVATILLRCLPPLFARRILCPSRMAAGWYPPARCLVLPNFLPDAPGGEGETSARLQLGLPAHRPLLLWVGSDAPRKGALALLEAFARISIIRPEVQLVMVCQRSSRYQAHFDRITTQARKRGESIILRTGVDDATPYYQAASVVLQTSLLPESFGLTVLEAMAAGRPVVCPGGGGMDDFVRHGTNALVADPANGAAFAGAILSLLDDLNLTRRLGEAGHATAFRYRADTVLPALEELYRRE